MNVTSSFSPVIVTSVSITSVSVSHAASFILAAVYTTTGLLGLLGNVLVIFVILHEAKMRRSATNLLILNMAVADANIMLLGLPEIAQFVSGSGWVLGLGACKALRFHMVTCLYVSVLSLTAVCVERYIAIVHPIRAAVICRRKVIVSTMAVTWLVSAMCALPTAIFNTVSEPASDRGSLSLCTTNFPHPHRTYYNIYKLAECLVFFVLPVTIQAALYAIVSKHLFATTFPPASASTAYAVQWATALNGEQISLNSNRPTDKLAVAKRCSHLPVTAKGDRLSVTGGRRQLRGSDRSHQQPQQQQGCSANGTKIVQARRDVVKMLIASVVIYFVCYAPAQLPLLHNLIFTTPFAQNWYFHALIMTLAYTNSAINPLLYTVFSQKFRQQFSRYLCYRCYSRGECPPTGGSLVLSRRRFRCDANDAMQLTSSVSSETPRHGGSHCTNYSDRLS